LVQYRRVTDGQKDGWTYDDSTYRASIASRGKMAYYRIFDSHVCDTVCCSCYFN